MQTRRWLTLCLLLFACVLSGCARKDAVLQPSPTHQPASPTATLEPQVRPSQSASSGTAHPSSTPSPTVSPTASSTPRPSPTSRFTPTATLPPAAPALVLPPGVEVGVLLGTDYVFPYAGRTDTIILVFLNRTSGGVSLVSVPRDLYVWIPGKGMQRINTAYGQGGIDLLYQTLEYNLGVKPSHWALAHLDDFVHFVDDLGGVTIQVTYPLPHDCGGIPEGEVHLSGEAALCFVRERRTSNDFSRSLRQQQVLLALFKKFISLDNLRKLPDWYSRYSNVIRTDVTLTDLLFNVPLAMRLRNGAGFHTFQIGYDQVQSWRVPETGASVLLPKRDKIFPILQTALKVLATPIPTPADLAYNLAQLTATPTFTLTPLPPTETPTPTQTEIPTDTPEVPPEPPTDTPTETPVETATETPSEANTSTPEPTAGLAEETATPQPANPGGSQTPVIVQPFGLHPVTPSLAP